MAEIAAEQRALDLPSPTPAEEMVPAGSAGPLESEESEEQVDYGSPLSSYRCEEGVQEEATEMEATEAEPEPKPFAGTLTSFLFFSFVLFFACNFLTQVFYLDTSVIGDTSGNGSGEGALVLGPAPIFETSLEEDILAASPLPEPTPDTPEPSFAQGPIPDMPGPSSHSGGPFPGIFSFNYFFLFFFYLFALGFIYLCIGHRYRPSTERAHIGRLTDHPGSD